jgi:hypothetical protein
LDSLKKEPFGLLMTQVLQGVEGDQKKRNFDTALNPSIHE